MLRQQAVVCIRPHVPRVRSRDRGEEVVRVPTEHSWPVLRNLTVEENLRRLGHTGDGPAAEVAERGYRPRIEIRVHQLSPSLGGNPRIHHELSVRLDAIDAARNEEPVEVVIKLVDVFLGYNGHLPAHREISPQRILADHLLCFIDLCEITFGGDACPIAEESVPNGNVLDVWVLRSNVGYRGFETPWKGFWFRFKVVPSMLKLSMPSIIYILPIVINDQTSDIDLILSQSVNGF